MNDSLSLRELVTMKITDDGVNGGVTQVYASGSDASVNHQNNNKINSAGGIISGGADDPSDFQWLQIDIDYHSVMSYLASGAMIFGGVLPYIPQYQEIKRTENASGFSTHVCLALIAANTLRIIFWSVLNVIR